MVTGDDQPDEPARPPTLARAIRGAFGAYLDEIVLFLAVNLAWVLAIILFALVRAIVPALIVLAPLLALPAAVLMRLAVAAARDRSPTWAMASAELRRLMGRKLLIAAVQLLLMGLGTVNFLLAGAIGGLPGILSALVAGYAVILTAVYATVLWPIVCDPQREAPLVDQLRLALAAMILRPLQAAVLTLLTALAVGASLQLIVPGIFLPSLVLLAIAGYVVPVVDRIRPAE